MRLLAIDQKGNWKLVKKNDLIVDNPNYEIYQLSNWFWKFGRLSVKVGLLLGFMIYSHKISSPNIFLGFNLLLMLELIRTIRW